MSVWQMREELKTLYKSAWKWVNKVNRMGDQQVIAVYYRMKQSGQLK